MDTSIKAFYTPTLPNEILGWGSAPPRFRCQKVYLTFPVALANLECTFFCPPMTQELSKEHHKIGLSEQLFNYAWSQIHYRHTGHCHN